MAAPLQSFPEPVSAGPADSAALAPAATPPADELEEILDDIQDVIEDLEWVTANAWSTEWIKHRLAELRGRLRKTVDDGRSLIFELGEKEE